MNTCNSIKLPGDCFMLDVLFKDKYETIIFEMSSIEYLMNAGIKFYDVSQNGHTFSIYIDDLIPYIQQHYPEYLI